jgi:hypothetical protein
VAETTVKAEVCEAYVKSQEVYSKSTRSHSEKKGNYPNKNKIS